MNRQQRRQVAALTIPKPDPDYKPAIVEFVSYESLVNMLDGAGVAVEFDDGTEAVGVWTKFVPRDGSQTMVDIRAVLDPGFIIVGTDVRNFTKITVL